MAAIVITRRFRRKVSGEMQVTFANSNHTCQKAAAGAESAGKCFGDIVGFGKVLMDLPTHPFRITLLEVISCIFDKSFLLGQRRDGCRTSIFYTSRNGNHSVLVLLMSRKCPDLSEHLPHTACFPLCHKRDTSEQKETLQFTPE